MIFAHCVVLQSLQSYDYWPRKLFQVVELGVARGHFCHIKIVLVMISTSAQLLDFTQTFIPKGHKSASKYFYYGQ